jgi:hypothetical protein
VIKTVNNKNYRKLWQYTGNIVEVWKIRNCWNINLSKANEQKFTTIWLNRITFCFKTAGSLLRLKSSKLSVDVIEISCAHRDRSYSLRFLMTSYGGTAVIPSEKCCMNPFHYCIESTTARAFRQGSIFCIFDSHWVLSLDIQFENVNFIRFIGIGFQFFTHPYDFFFLNTGKQTTFVGTHFCAFGINAEHPFEIINVMSEELIIHSSAWNKIEILKLSEGKEQDEKSGTIGIVDTRKSGLVQKQEHFTIYTNYGKNRNKLNAGKWQRCHCRMLLEIALDVTGHRSLARSMIDDLSWISWLFTFIETDLRFIM